MHALLASRKFHYAIAVTFIVAALILIVRVGKNGDAELVTATAERGGVLELVSVSGFV